MPAMRERRRREASATPINPGRITSVGRWYQSTKVDNGATFSRQVTIRTVLQ